MGRDAGWVRTVVPCLAVALVAALAATASADDGVVEINQARALAGGVTASDTPGFPVTIDSPGSYRLTGNLVVPDENTRGIDIQVGFVTMDLNGFEISGPVTCTGQPVSCSPLGVGTGIEGGGDYVAVLNGTVRGMGSAGVRLLQLGASAVRVRAEQNAGHGIVLGLYGSATECRALRNGWVGLIVDEGNVISRSVVSGNRRHGIQMGSDSVTVDNVLSGNGDGGGFFGHGIFAWGSGGSVIRRNTVSDNTESGISTFANSAILGNTLRGNGSWGLELGAAGYEGNVFSANGSTVLGGVEIGTNLCDGSTSCP
jgi:parallel beta-helix repeat protein